MGEDLGFSTESSSRAVAAQRAAVIQERHRHQVITQQTRAYMDKRQHALQLLVFATNREIIRLVAEDVSHDVLPRAQMTERRFFVGEHQRVPFRRADALVRNGR